MMRAPAGRGNIVQVRRIQSMKFALSHVLIATIVLLAGCSSARLVPPADVPAATQAAVPSDTAGWRPYSSGPLQAASPGISGGSRTWTSPARQSSVTRQPLPDVKDPATPRTEESQKAAALESGGQWQTYRGERTARVARPSSDPSVFGKGIESSWAKGYVPSSHYTEFGIFAAKAAADGQARMVMPTGEVYSASIVRRNGPCRSLEVTVTADGDLPIIARGPAEVCR